MPVLLLVQREYFQSNDTLPTHWIFLLPEKMHEVLSCMDILFKRVNFHILKVHSNLSRCYKFHFIPN